MIMDGIGLRAVSLELDAALAGGRVDRISQPERDQLILSIRTHGATRRLLLSASADHCRAHLTEATWKNPEKAPMLCMLLRKLLTGARVRSVAQQGLERILTLTLENTDELGRPAEYTLVTEIMGRHSNIILVSGDGAILESVKHVSPGMSRVRQVLPGLPYAPPPAQDKLNPLTMDSAALTSLLKTHAGGALDRFLTARLSGISQATAKDLIEGGLGTRAPSALSPEQIDAFAAYLAEFFGEAARGNFTPTLILGMDGKPAAFAPYYPSFLPRELLLKQPDMSRLLDVFYLERDLKDRISQKAQALTQALHVRLERSRGRLALHSEMLADPEKGEAYRLYGELLTASLHTLKKGMRVARVPDYYGGDGAMLDIPLDERLSPAANAQRYYRLYAKHKSALDNAREQEGIARAEIEYYETQLFNISQCTDAAEIDEIRRELELAGVLRGPSSKKRRLPPPTQPLAFLSSDGLEIRVGKNGSQNDALTLKWAQPHDIWLHAKDMPGSHVVLRTDGRDVPDRALLEAATLAALHSAGKNATTVPVDYTLKKYVKKPSGAKPGMVIYTHQKTLYIPPDADVVKGVRTV